MHSHLNPLNLGRLTPKNFPSRGLVSFFSRPFKIDSVYSKKILKPFSKKPIKRKSSSCVFKFPKFKLKKQITSVADAMRPLIALKFQNPDTPANFKIKQNPSLNTQNSNTQKSNTQKSNTQELNKHETLHFFKKKSKLLGLHRPSFKWWSSISYRNKKEQQIFIKIRVFLEKDKNRFQEKRTDWNKTFLYQKWEINRTTVNKIAVPFLKNSPILWASLKRVLHAILLKPLFLLSLSLNDPKPRFNKIKTHLRESNQRLNHLKPELDPTRLKFPYRSQNVIKMNQLRNEKITLINFILKKESYLISWILSPNGNRPSSLRFIFINLHFRFMTFFLFSSQNRIHSFFKGHLPCLSERFLPQSYRRLIMKAIDPIWNQRGEMRPEKRLRMGILAHSYLLDLDQLLGFKAHCCSQSRILTFSKFSNPSPNIAFLGQGCLLGNGISKQRLSQRPERRRVLWLRTLFWDGYQGMMKGHSIKRYWLELSHLEHFRVQKYRKLFKNPFKSNWFSRLDSSLLKPKTLEIKKNALPVLFPFINSINPLWNEVSSNSVLFWIESLFKRGRFLQNRIDTELLNYKKPKNKKSLREKLLPIPFKKNQDLNDLNDLNDLYQDPWKNINRQLWKTTLKRNFESSKVESWVNLWNSKKKTIFLLQGYSLENKLDKPFWNLSQKTLNSRSRAWIYNKYALIIQFEIIHLNSAFLSKNKGIPIENNRFKKQQNFCFFKSNLLHQFSFSTDSKDYVFSETEAISKTFFSLSSGLKPIFKLYNGFYQTHFHLITVYFYRQPSMTA